MTAVVVVRATMPLAIFGLITDDNTIELLPNVVYICGYLSWLNTCPSPLWGWVFKQGTNVDIDFFLEVRCPNASLLYLWVLLLASLTKNSQGKA